jgi:glycosidase
MLRRTKLAFAPIALVSTLAAAAPFACTPSQLGAGGGGQGGASGSTTGVGGEVAQVGGGGSSACVTPGMECMITFTFPLNNQKSVELRGDFAPGAWEKGVHMSLDDEEWKASIDAKDGQQIQYKFFVDGTTWENDPNNMNTVSDGNGGLNNVTTAMCPGTHCEPDGGAGGSDGEYDWRSAFLYFVFVDRFNNGDKTNDAPLPNIETAANWQGGDYAGVIAKISAGYFDDLGVNALWITVPCNNTNGTGLGADGHNYSAYHGYWPDDCNNVEEHFGTMTLLKKLVDTAHKHKIKVLFDYAMNHVYQDADVYAQHNDWFWPLDYNGKTCICGDGCSWDDPYEGKRCWFESYLPDWNYTVPEARAYSVNNAVSWITKTGIDGFRLDAVKNIEPTWVTDLRTAVTNTIEPKSHQHFYMVGETYTTDRDLIKSFVDPTTDLDGQFDFPLRGTAVEALLRRTGTMFDLDNFLASNDDYYDPGIMSPFLGNQDLVRTIMTALDQPWDAWSDGGDAKWNNRPFSDGSLPPRSAYERMAVGFTFLLTTKGIPLVYYGDEIGMPGAGDPDNRRFMQWDNWSTDQTFLHDTIAKLGKARQAHPALWKGVRVTKSVTNDTYAYEMTEGKDTVYVALNRGDVAAAVANMPAKAKDLLTGKTVTGPSITLDPRTSMVLVEE